MAYSLVIARSMAYSLLYGL